MHVITMDNTFALGSAAEAQQFGLLFHTDFKSLKPLTHLEDKQYGVEDWHPSVGA